MRRSSLASPFFLSLCKPLGGTGLLKLEQDRLLRNGAEERNHLPAIYIYMSNSTGVPSLSVKQLESREEHFPPTELELR